MRARGGHRISFGSYNPYSFVTQGLKPNFGTLGQLFCLFVSVFVCPKSFLKRGSATPAQKREEEREKDK